MPKRVFGMCPDCGRFISKRGGKLKAHFPVDLLDRKRGSFFNPERRADPLCAGGGKRVPTHNRTLS
jgi:hypothetical protein